MDTSQYLKVPKSGIPVGRLSRAVSRPQGNPFRRSSSLIRPSTSNIPVVTINKSRSRSCAAQNDVNCTPVCRPSTSNLALSSSTSKYSANKKEWANAQLPRVKNFLLQLDPDMPNIKPLDTKIYIRCMNLLWKQLDHRINITDKNKGSIAEYLKLFKFPGQIKLSVLKTPTVPHNFSYILTIWVWLLDTIESIYDPNRILGFPTAEPFAVQLHDLSLSYLTNKFNLFTLNKNTEEDQVEGDFKNNYRDLLLKGNNCDLPEVLESIKNLKEEASKAKENLTSVTKEAAELRTKVEQEEQSLQNDIVNFEARKMAVLANEKKILERKQYLLDVLREKQKLQKKLKDAAQNQPCSHAKWRSLMEEKDSLTFGIQLKKKRKNEKRERLSKMDMELCEERQQVQVAIDSINAKSAMLLQQRPEQKQFQLREYGFFREDMIEEINQFVCNKKMLDEKLVKELQSKKVELDNIQLLNEQYMNSEKQLLIRHGELDKEKQEVMKDLEQLRKSNQEQLEHYESKIKELEDMIKNMQTTERPNLEQLKEKEQRYLKQCAKLIEERDELIKHGQEFLVGNVRTLLRGIDGQIALSNKLTEGVNKTKGAIHKELLNICENLEEDV